MGRAANPITFARQFRLNPKDLKALGVFNPTLAIDSLLFIDPLLLAGSKHQVIRDKAGEAYRKHFERIVTLLTASRIKNDVPWRNAERLLSFREVPGTCLGYSSDTVFGHGFGRELAARLVDTAHQIIQLGITDPDLFLVLALLEDGVGPDLISDMATNVVLDPILEFNAQILKRLGVKTERFELFGHHALLPRNPLARHRIPVILVPADILRDLPVALDWNDVTSAAWETQSIRDRVNRHIGAIWEGKARRDKHLLKSLALASRESFQSLLDAVHAVPANPYDISNDPLGRVSWPARAEEVARAYPLHLERPSAMTLERAHGLVGLIISHFGHLVEDEGASRLLWHEGRALPERYSQYLFFAIAHAYCRANDLDLSPEVDTGTGKVDFKFSSGFKQRVLVEIKLSSNSNVLSGYSFQLEAYKRAQQTTRAYYLVIDLGTLGKRRDMLANLRNEGAKRGDPVSDLAFIDGMLPEAASRRRR
jgi:hypothetical protein